MLKNNKQKIDKKVLYAEAVYDYREKNAVMESLENQWLASGPKVKKFEDLIAKYFNKQFGIAVNSGSSANLLAVSAFNFPKGGKVITPALTFATTVSEIVLNGLIPVFVDGVIGRYTINEDLIEDAIDNKTVAIMVPQLIGGICDMFKLRTLADKYNLKLIDDCCDTFAPELNGNKVAQYADVSTTSFYGSHVITACGVGGMVMTNNEQLRDNIVTLRDWGRVGSDKEDFEERFKYEVDNIPYDSKFMYSHLGYNLKMNEASAAFGLEQLKKLHEFAAIRKRNFDTLYHFFKDYEEFFYLPEIIRGARTIWLAFPLTIRENAPFTRYDFLKHLENKSIQTRVLFSGNITRHPIYRNGEQVKYEVSGSLKNADLIMGNGLLLGAHHGMSEDDAKYICESAKEFLNEFKR